MTAAGVGAADVRDATSTGTPRDGSGPGAGEPAGSRADDQEAARRWRLVLGRYSGDTLPVAPQDQGLDRTLGHLYDREYTARGHRHGDDDDSRAGRGGGGRGGSVVAGLDWLESARELFPRETFERMQVEAVGRYGMTELLADPRAVDAVEPSTELASALLRARGRLGPGVQDGLKRLVERVVEDVVRRLRPRFATAVDGRRDRSRRSFVRSSRTFDAAATVRANLGRWDPERRRLLVTDLRFSARRRRALSYDVVLLVDQSGSMASSVLYSAVSAGILAGLPGITVRLVLFDTSVVDMSHLAHDPVTVLLTAQLGGGTDIARAVRYAEQHVRDPRRTVVALVTDFEEGGSVSQLVASVGRLHASGVRLLGLAALDGQANPAYDRGVARRLAEQGMEIAALTPERFAEWLGEALP